MCLKNMNVLLSFVTFRYLDILDLQTAYSSYFQWLWAVVLYIFSSFMVFYTVKMDMILITETEDLRHILTSYTLVWSYKAHLPLYSNASF